MTQVTHDTIGYGDYGSAQTLDKMRTMVNRSLSVPLVVEQAAGIAATVPPRDYYAIAQAIREWMQRHYRFVRDPVGVELLRDPEYQLGQWMQRGYIAGDCDDAAVLGAALGKAVGLVASFYAVGFSPRGPLVHVYTVLTPPNQRGIGSGVDLDVTRPATTRARILRSITRRV